MRNKDKVITSKNSHDETLCVDIFLRCDGTYGFEQYRRDYEENRWYPISSFGHFIFESYEAVNSYAIQYVKWYE